MGGLDPAKWAILVGSLGVSCGSCREVLIKAHHPTDQIPTHSDYILGAVKDHLPNCRRVKEVIEGESCYV
jgi:hypothetical protein